MSDYEKGLRRLADHLYQIAEDGSYDMDKTAAEVESEMQVYLKAELMPLLDAAQTLLNSNDYDDGKPLTEALKTELTKWTK